MKYYLIVGEASGDLHASNLMSALKEKDPDADFRFFGGDLMQQVGGTLVKHYREMAFMGIVPVLMHLRIILHNMDFCRSDIRKYAPDVVILVDYPGFNLKIARYVKSVLQIPVYYYISPKIWAWKQYRIKEIRRYVDRMFCILPFETDFYKRFDYQVDYVGNPSVDSVDAFRRSYTCSFESFASETGLDGRPLLALVAGSRRQEIKDNLPVMMEVACAFPQLQPVIAGAPGIEPEFYAKYTVGSDVRLLFGKTYEIMEHASYALVTSGTATLETCLFGVPQVVCYKTPGGYLANWVFKHFFHVPYISLVNLVAGEEVVQELFGGRFTKASIVRELGRLINDNAYRSAMKNGYDEVLHALGAPGAALRAAGLIYESLSH